VTTSACVSSSARIAATASSAAAGRLPWRSSPIDDEVRQIELLDRGRYRFDDRRGREHAGLDRRRRQVAADRLDLRDGRARSTRPPMP
jgi:hypothetical protein